MSKPFGSGSVTVQPSRGLWQASYLGQKDTYSEARFGPMAETLAHRALLKLQAGNFDPVSDDLQFKLSWRMLDAARQLGLSLGQLRQWMLTGMLNGHEIKPPMRDVKGVDRITGCELMMGQERLAECKSGLSLCNG